MTSHGQTRSRIGQFHRVLHAVGAPDPAALAPRAAGRSRSLAPSLKARTTIVGLLGLLGFLALTPSAWADVTITGGEFQVNSFNRAQTHLSPSDLDVEDDPTAQPISGSITLSHPAHAKDADASSTFGTAHGESAASGDLTVSASSVGLQVRATGSMSAEARDTNNGRGSIVAIGGSAVSVEIDFTVSAPTPFTVGGIGTYNTSGGGLSSACGTSGVQRPVILRTSDNTSISGTTGTLDPGSYQASLFGGACTSQIGSDPTEDTGTVMADMSMGLTVGQPSQPDPTTTSLVCPGDSNHPPTPDTGVPITCTVLVDDTCAVNCASSRPSGSVTFGFADGVADPGCTLTPSTTAGRSTCQVSVTATKAGMHTVSAAYPGDSHHAASNVTGSFTSGDHYEIELKAWIPQDHVLDPDIPHQVPYPVLTTPFFLPAIQAPRAPCFLFPEGLELPQIFVSSQFKGDAHAVYDGSFRVRPVADFDLENGQIKNFKVSSPADSFGLTSLDYTFRAGGLFGIHQCSEQKQQVAAADGRQLSDTSFELSMSADDPLVYPRGLGPDSPFVPNIDSTLVGSFDSQGNLILTATHDLFPSHGLRVIHNGVLVETKVTNDVSCLDQSTVEGFVGLGLLAYSLGQSEQDPPFTVAPEQAEHTTVVPAPSCDSSFFTLDLFSFGKSLFAAPDASQASAGSRLLVAPQRGAHAGQFLPLQAAVNAGLITSYDAGGGHLVLGINPAQPVLLKTNGTVAVTSTEITDGKPKTSQQFGPLSGNIELRLTGERANVTDNGKPARPHTVDVRPPRTTAKIVTHGKTATVTITARDPSGIKFTIVTAGGKRIKLQHDRFNIATRKLRTVRVFSVDTFDNAETPHRLRL